MPKCSTADIQLEIAALKQGGFKCAVYYLEAELRRREHSSHNRGAQPKADTEQRRKWREAKRQQRENKRAALIARAMIPEIEADMLNRMEDERKIVPFDEA